jgi:lipid-binding SYLF domain-containing protein
MTVRRCLIALTLFCAATTAAFAGPREEGTLLKATQVIEDTQAMPDESVPDWLLRRAYGIVVIPSLIKVGLVGLGGRGGAGVLLVRDEQGRWRNPSFVTTGGGSIGPQFGIEASDLVLVFTTRRSIEGITGGKLTLGAGASVAAGPVGRQISGSTDIGGAEIYSYSRSKGFFAGISIDGVVIRVDNKGNAALYGKPGILASEIFASNEPAPAAAQRLLTSLRHLPSMADGAAASPTSAAPTTAPMAPQDGVAPGTQAPGGRALESGEPTTYPLNGTPKR